MNNNKWIAGLLAFFLPPMGLAYARRPGWAVASVVALLGMVAGFLYLAPGALGFGGIGIAAVALQAACAVVAFKAVSRLPAGAAAPWFARWTGLLVILAAHVGLVFGLRAFVAEPFQVPSRSMEPTLPAGSLIVVTKWGYGHYGTFGLTPIRRPISARLDRGDVVVFDFPENPDVAFVMRLVGLPGDAVAWQDKSLAINGTVVTRDPASAADGSGIRTATEQLGDTVYDVRLMDDVPPVRMGAVRNFARRDQCRHDASGFACRVPDGHYFVLGDSRDLSDDSRYWGFVPAAAIVGVVRHVIPPT